MKLMNVVSVEWDNRVSVILSYLCYLPFMTLPIETSVALHDNVLFYVASSFKS